MRAGHGRGWTAYAVAGVALALLTTGCGGGSEVAGVGPRVTETAPAKGDADSTAATTALDSPKIADLRARARLASCPGPERGSAGQAAGKQSATDQRQAVVGADASRRPLPDVTLACLGSGPDVALGQLKGPAVLNLWAQWCPPCREEAPHFQALHEQAGDQLLVLGIDYDDPRPDLALALAADLGLRYPQVVDADKKLLAPFGMFVGLPATVFVDADGRIAHVVHRPYRSEQQLRQDVRTYLGVTW